MNGRLKSFGLVLAGAFAGILVSLNFQAIGQLATRSPLPVEELRSFTEVFGAIKQNYVEPVEDKKLITEAINGMLSGLDPHSAYLDAESYKELRVGTEGKFGGLGIEVGMEDGLVKVISPIEDTPAYRAGIKPGDFIVKLDDQQVKGMTLNDAVKRMRGREGTKITLTIVRKGEAQPIVVTLTRAEIQVQSVKSRLIEPGYGWVRVSQFQEKSAEDLVRHIGNLYKQGPLKGLVLDLRNDPGGLLYGAVAISAAFLPAKALVVSTDGRTEDAKKKFFATSEDFVRGSGEELLRSLPAGVKTVPMVVLVNGGSASASEIVAGALQDHKRATVMGSQTFGKGSVQQVLDLPPDGKTGVKLTISRYYTPSGRSIQAKGIEPDLVVDDTAEGNLITYPREVDLAKHIANDRSAEAAARKEEEAKAIEEERKRLGQRRLPEYGSKDDFQLRQALNHLKGLPVETHKTLTAAGTPGAKASEAPVARK